MALPMSILESDPAMLGVSYTKVNGQLTLGPATASLYSKAPYTMQTPLSWAFDPWPTQGLHIKQS